MYGHMPYVAFAARSRKPTDMTAANAARSDRIELRATPEEKALLVRAAAHERLDLTAFVMRAALPAEQVVKDADRIALSERDTRHVLDLLENPPAPSKALLKAAHARNAR